MCVCDQHVHICVHACVCVCDYAFSPNHKSNEVGGSHQMEKEGLQRVLLSQATGFDSRGACDRQVQANQQVAS